jgi:uncharacterized membrane protein YphA (DoxX/SURF4 family)
MTVTKRLFNWAPFVRIAQILLAASFIWAALMKLFQSPEKLAAMWPWTRDNAALVKSTGILDLLSGMGILLPFFIRLPSKFLRYTAWCIIALMVAASIYHVSRGEAAKIGINIVFALLAVFIAWRYRPAAGS